MENVYLKKKKKSISYWIKNYFKKEKEQKCL